MDTINLEKLAHALHAVPEEKGIVEGAPVNSYLKEHLLPMFYDDRYPSLNELDFDQFERDDLCNLAYYIQSLDRLEYNLTSFNNPIQLATPKAARTRAFI